MKDAGETRPRNPIHCLPVITRVDVRRNIRSLIRLQNKYPAVSISNV